MLKHFISWVLLWIRSGILHLQPRQLTEAIDRMLDAYKDLQQKDLKHFRTLTFTCLQ